MIQYEAPCSVEQYVHRAGRTARGTKKGRVVSFVTQHEVQLLKNVEAKVAVKIGEYKKYDEQQVLKEMNKLDKTKRKLKIKFLVKGKEEKFQKIKKKKRIQRKTKMIS